MCMCVCDEHGKHKLTRIDHTHIVGGGGELKGKREVSKECGELPCMYAHHPKDAWEYRREEGGCTHKIVRSGRT